MKTPDITMPDRIKALPICPRRGVPVPWFVSELPDGTRDFRVVDAGKMVRAVKQSLCWICGKPLGKIVAFNVGPLGLMQRISAEPPSHRECSEYAVKVCPFLVNPNVKYSVAKLPEGDEDLQIQTVPMTNRNPGVAVVWVTQNWKFAGPKMMFQFGTPIEVLWFHEGKPATRTEVIEGMEKAFPTLRDKAAGLGPDHLKMVNRMFEFAQRYVPKE